LKKLDKIILLYYNISLTGDDLPGALVIIPLLRAMTHHHHSGHLHPPAGVGPSFLRMSAAGRLAVVAVAVVLLWGAAFWAMY